MSATPIFKLAPTTQQYDWGKQGSSAKVAQFAAASQLPGFIIDESKPYAELWMGTHPKSPSHVYITGEVLSEHLAKHPELIGASVSEKFDASNGNLPFLFKVLSIQKALSIQSHPDKATAEKLHAAQPDIYKGALPAFTRPFMMPYNAKIHPLADPNHKPEMALALTPFRAMCGFRPLPDIAASLAHTPEFAALIPAPTLSSFLALSSSSTPTGPEEKAALRSLFEAVMTAPEASFKPQLEALVARYRNADRAGGVREGENEDLVWLVLTCEEQFPGDIGTFCAFLLNYVTLQPGEAIYLGAGEPHAYVSGGTSTSSYFIPMFLLTDWLAGWRAECIECMANSDNVIRAGLTPKLRDIPNLISTLTYTASPPSKHFVAPSAFSTTTSSPSTPNANTLYDPPAPEFSVVQLKLASKGAEETHRAVDGPSIVVATGGTGEVRWGAEGRLEIGTGDVFFVGAGTEVRFVAHASDEEFVLYRAFVEAH
ncbi:hypothetical protein H0H92_005994 [Tricholoma furcatifolium]|nr:hypothetical protein H0H92_005994 [Tricholoma furcatifolium]